MTATDTAANSGTSLTVLMIVNNQDRSRDFYHNVLGAEIVRDRDPVILRFHNGVIVLKAGGGPTADKPTVTMAPRRPRHRQHGPQHPRGRHPRHLPCLARERAEFLTPPQDRDSEIRCYLRDPDGYLIEVGQTTRA